MKWAIPKEELDSFAVQNHQRAHRAQKEGRFDREIAPVNILGVEGAEKVFDKDETIRPETSLEAFLDLKPVFGIKTITMGNSSPISDGVSAVLLMSGSMVQNFGLKPRARILSSAVAEADPVMILTGPILATARVMRMSGLKIDDFDRIEINEAFASVPLAWGMEYKPDWEKANPIGGAIALGHPVGNSGCRLVVTCLHELERIQGRYGLISLWAGGGLAPTVVIERL